MAKLAAADLLDIAGLDNLKPQEAFQHVLKELHNRKNWLIVFDNVDDFEMCNAVKQILPSLKNGKVIITSRLPNWTGNIKPLLIEKLSIDASIEYLLLKTKDKRRLSDNDKEKVRELAEKLDGLPVALEQAAAYICYNTLTFEQYLKDFEEVELDVLGFDAKELSMSDYKEPVLRTWVMTEKKLDANAKAILTISAFLAPDNIPNSLLMNQSNIVLEISDILEKKKHVKVKNEIKSQGNPKAIRDAIAQLNSYSMISLNVSDESFSIHRLVQEVTRLRLSKENIEFLTQLILTMIDIDCPDYETAIKTNFSWSKAMDRHISEIIAFANRLWPDVSSIPKNIAGSLATQINNLELFYKYYARFSEGEILINRAIKIYEKAFGNEHPNVATSMNNLAMLYQATNRLKEAEPLMVRALEIDEKAFGKEHPNVARNLNNLATLYSDTNRIIEAEPLYKRALEIDERTFGKEHPNVARDLNNLALLYKDTNRLKEAEPIMVRALEIDEKAFGKEHPKIAIRLSSLAALYRDTNRLKEAEPIMVRALEIDEKAFGKEHPDVAIALNNLAALYRDINRLKEAEPIMVRVVSIFEKSLGKEHPKVATSMNNLAALYRDTNRLKEAEPLMVRAFEIDEKAFGKEHPNVARDLNNLAQLYQDTNRLKDAEPLTERCLIIFIQFTRQTGHPHPRLQAAINNFASLLQQIGYSKEQVKERLKKLMPEMFG